MRLRSLGPATISILKDGLDMVGMKGLVGLLGAANYCLGTAWQDCTTADWCWVPSSCTHYHYGVGR